MQGTDSEPGISKSRSQHRMDDDDLGRDAVSARRFLELVVLLMRCGSSPSSPLERRGLPPVSALARVQCPTPRRDERSLRQTRPTAQTLRPRHPHVIQLVRRASRLTTPSIRFSATRGASTIGHAPQHLAPTPPPHPIKANCINFADLRPKRCLRPHDEKKSRSFLCRSAPKKNAARSERRSSCLRRRGLVRPLP